MAMAKFSGSCICGSISYTITGEPHKFFHCYCMRCRKSSGTGHASNILLKSNTVTWEEGEQLLSSFKVPDAERFRTVFCSKCGSPMPRLAPNMSIAVIPAGSLDSQLPLPPTDRIFYTSKTDWSCTLDDIPTWSEYPE